MIKKKIAAVFVTSQSLDYYKSSGFFDKIVTQFDIEVLKPNSVRLNMTNISEIDLPRLDFPWQAGLIKYIKEKASLRLNDKLFNSKNHILYAQFKHATSIKQLIKFNLINLLSFCFVSKKGINFLELKLISYIKKTFFFKEVVKIISASKPDLVYLTHQNTSQTLGVSIVAKHLGIPTVCFIYSWDNIVKGNKLVKADYYFVWSDYMKQELLDYYDDEVSCDTVFVVGSPQFHHYQQDDFLIDKTTFFNAYRIPKSDFYICFSGNFTAIGQDDPAYLRDLAKAVKHYNSKNVKQFHILLRANPADYNEGFLPVLKAYPEFITDVNPDWKITNQPLPVSENKLALSVLKTTIKYSNAMINVGSTMALDATLLNTLAYYIDYKIKKGSKKFRIEDIYKFIHFKSQKETDNPIKHLKNKKAFLDVFNDIQYQKNERLLLQQNWAKIIVKHPIDKVSERMLAGFKKIATPCT